VTVPWFILPVQAALSETANGSLINNTRLLRLFEILPAKNVKEVALPSICLVDTHRSAFSVVLCHINAIRYTTLRILFTVY
jgi:hypothetical protein